MPSGLQQLGGAIVSVKDFISKSYMKQFTDPTCSALRINNIDKVKIGLRLLKIEQITLSDEEIESRLTSIYQSISQLVNTCFTVIQGTKQGISLYIGFQAEAAGTAESALIQTLVGNFPGIIISSLNANEISTVMKMMESNSISGLKTVSCVSVVPSERDEKKSLENVQGLEKFMDTMQGKEFTGIIIATPYDDLAINKRILALESISTTLSSLEQTTVQDSQSQMVSITDSTAQTISNTITNSINNAYSIGTAIGTINQRGKGNAFTITPLGLGISFTGQNSVGTSNTQLQNASYGQTFGTAVGRADMTSQALAQSQGVARTVTKTEVNKEVQNLRKKVDAQVERLRCSEAQGLWDCCGYFVANSNDTAIIAANSFRGLVTGDSTSIEQTVINLWQPTLPSEPVSNHAAISNLTESLMSGVAPVFSINGLIRKTDSIVTGRELSRMLSFPRKSSGTVSVVKMASFGRSVHLIGGNGKDNSDYISRSFPIGKVVHMGRIDGSEDTRLELSKLNAHVFATGATGAGKTTAIGDILHQLIDKKIPFTVIEPAKGEYGEIWGKLPEIEVYSTTPFRYRMLRINPFAFDDSVHILNHMERLISVFSTAWPLYAAQPAILRDCVRMAYIKCGWDITNSICLRKEKVYPTFIDVLRELPEAIKKSKFVGEAKGTYEGALQTRLSMLTEGIFKEMFCNQSNISDEELFDKNVIIDLSRLGSQETLSLTMGLLLIRLYEHRTRTGKSKGLRHVTVLEEAHNILKKNQEGPQGGDVSSIAAKSVEVLTKCITELRFTGEGFIIADQSPGEVDATAIKNTSTKIVMRLQDSDDQKSIGSALALSTDQMAELSKLDNGVGVVFQEGWVEPILTKFNYYNNPYSVQKTDVDYLPEATYEDVCAVRGYLVKIILNQFQLSRFDFEEYQTNLKRISHFSIWKLKDYGDLFNRYMHNYETIKDRFNNNRVRYPFFGKLLQEVLDATDLFNIIEIPTPDSKMKKPYSKDIDYKKQCLEWKESMLAALDLYCKGLQDDEKEMVIKLMLLAEGEENSARILVCSTAF